MDITWSPARPTQSHRVAIVMGILGTVYGVNANGRARYFDYDLDGAYAYAGVTQAGDPRWATPTRPAQYVICGCTEANPTAKTKCGWVLR